MLIAQSAFGTPRAPLVLALTAGVITAFNPCGFAMLPAYVSFFVGQSATAARRGLSTRLLRASVTGAVVTLGFMTVYGAIGLVATQFLAGITKAVPFISMVVGAALAVLGVRMLRGYELKVSLPMGRAREGSSLFSMYLYGISYALVSLSCGFAGFLATVVSASSERSAAASMGVYLAFTAGMGLVLIVVSFAVALAQQAVVRGMRRVLPYVNRTAGAMLMIAGSYVAYYGYYEWTTVTRGRRAPAGPIDVVQRWSDAFLRRVNGLSTTTLVAGLCATALVIALAFAAGRRRRDLARPQSPSPQEGAA